MLSACSEPRAAAVPGVQSKTVHFETHSAQGFVQIGAAGAGVTFTNFFRGEPYLTNAVAHNGAGLALGDIDADGLPDLYFCALQGPNRLYKNLGQWRFQERDAGPAACIGQISTGSAFADVDGDGDLDLLVNGIAVGTRLFLNDGAGRFIERPDSGLSKTASATSLTLADIDGDGDLDLYCTHFIDAMMLADPTTRFAVARKGDQWEVTRVNGESTRSSRWKGRFEALPDGKVRELPETHGLYRNLGGGKFQAIEFEPGTYQDEQGRPIPPFRDWGLAAMFRDLNGDGFPDLYVCNDNTSPDRIWINTGKGTFRALEAWKIRHTSRSSMGVDFADVNQDGLLDFFVVDMLARSPERRQRQLVRDRPDPAEYANPDARLQFNRNTLFLGRPGGGFAEAALFAGLAATDWSWTPLFMDVDLDGDEDLLVTNGFEFDVMDQDANDRFKNPKQRLSETELKRYLQLHPRWPTRNAAFRNAGSGRFEPAPSDWGFGHEGVSFGMAQADLDGDGDLDLVVNHLNEAPGLYRNDAPGARVLIRLQGSPPNTRGIGARLVVDGPQGRLDQEVIAGGRYLSGDEPARMFAVGNAGPSKLEVRWPSGRRTVIPELKPNSVYDISEPKDPAAASPFTKRDSEPGLFEFSSVLSHRHVDEAFDENLWQPLLPMRLGSSGPGVSGVDWTGDGWDDLAVSAGREGKLALFVNQAGRGFRELPHEFKTAGDQAAILAWPDGRGGRALLVAMSNYKLPPGTPSKLFVLSAQDATVRQELDLGASALSCLAAADVDGDGDLDVFAGGRCHPGRVPEPADSTLLMNDAGRLVPAESAPFRRVGMISSAVFADFDGDGDADLALAADWGSIRLFHNDQSRFMEVTSSAGLSRWTGRWNSLAVGDFDGDGQLDLVGGNAGRNTMYELYAPGPYRLYHGDWKGIGFLQLMEAAQTAGRWMPLRDRTSLSRDFPELLSRFPTHLAFASASVEQLLGAESSRAGSVEAAFLDSCVLLNRGGRWEYRALPMPAQLSMTFGLGVADWNADGVEDLILGQNHFGAEWDLDRQDAGGLVLLRGSGGGAFAEVDESRMREGPQGPMRGLAMGDFNRDSRVDLAVGEHQGATRIWMNRNAKSGLRVELEGPPGNPDGVGAVLRLVHPDGRRGPARVVSAGSGYLSQHAASQILGGKGSPSGVWIRWPGGGKRPSACPAVPTPSNCVSLREYI